MLGGNQRRGDCSVTLQEYSCPCWETEAHVDCNMWNMNRWEHGKRGLYFGTYNKDFGGRSSAWEEKLKQKQVP